MTIPVSMQNQAESEPLVPRPPSRGRDPALDALRGFLILCVVVGHFPVGIFNGCQPTWWSWLNETIYLFHVPLFFALSCFFVPGLRWRPLAISLLTILVPYTLWYAWQRPQLLWQQPGLWLQWLAQGNFQSLGSTLWFLPALVSVRLFASALQAAANRPGWLVAGAGLWLFGFANLDWIIAHHAVIPFGFDVAFVCLPYVALMLWVERNRAQVDAIPSFAWLVLAIGLGMLMYTTEPLKTHSGWLKRIDLAQLSVPHNLGSYALWSLLGAAWLMTFRRVGWKPFVLLGRHSFPIYLLHYEVFIWFMRKPVRLPGGPSLAASGLVFATAILLPLGLSLLARRLWAGIRWLGL